MILSSAQQQAINRWFGDTELVDDMSWGLVDTLVLRLRTRDGDVVIKAAGPNNSHIGREIIGHRNWTGPWLRDGRVNDLLHAEPEQNLIALSYLPGTLIQGTAVAGDPTTYRQAGELLAAFHGQTSITSDDYEARADARTLAWLDGEHRISPTTEAHLRSVIAAHDQPPTVLVPTHGDWQPRNWLIDDQRRLGIIDLGRADWRPAVTDFARMGWQDWQGRPDLEAAFFDGYGTDPRDPAGWRRILVREAIATACWAYQVGDETFEEKGHRMIRQALEGRHVSDAEQASKEFPQGASGPTDGRR